MSVSWQQPVIELLESKGALNILTIPVGNGVVDYFIIASGTSSRHVRALAQEIQKLCKGHESIQSHGDQEGSQWVVLDVFGIFVHIFGQESREIYDLEGLWQRKSLPDAPDTPAPLST